MRACNANRIAIPFVAGGPRLIFRYFAVGAIII